MESKHFKMIINRQLWRTKCLRSYVLKKSRKIPTRKFLKSSVACRKSRKTSICSQKLGNMFFLHKAAGITERHFFSIPKKLHQKRHFCPKNSMSIHGVDGQDMSLRIVSGPVISLIFIWCIWFGSIRDRFFIRSFMKEKGDPGSLLSFLLICLRSKRIFCFFPTFFREDFLTNA